jgi:hypothetical protein
MRDKEGNELFTCKECGSHRVKVVHQYMTTTTTQQSMPCACVPRAIAATRRILHVDSWEESFELDGQHRWSDPLGEPEKLESVDDEAEIEVTCKSCYEKGTWPAEEDDLSQEPREEQGSRDHRVECMGCGRELAFAWSHPGSDNKGTGLIWPVECTDYNPTLVWLDPRYGDGDD